MVTLVAYGTKHGSTAEVAQEMARHLRPKECPVKVIDLNHHEDVELEEFDLVVVGSGIVHGIWTREAIRFLENNRRALGRTRLAMFACCGDLLLDPGRADECLRSYVLEVADRYGLRPCKTGLFGGFLDFSRYGFLVNGILNGGKAGMGELKEKGIGPGLSYDLRDWSAIRRWAGELRGVE